jgi:hypothetical protein
MSTATNFYLVAYFGYFVVVDRSLLSELQCLYIYFFNTKNVYLMPRCRVLKLRCLPSAKMSGGVVDHRWDQYLLSLAANAGWCGWLRGSDPAQPKRILTPAGPFYDCTAYLARTSAGEAVQEGWRYFCVALAPTVRSQRSKPDLIPPGALTALSGIRAAPASPPASIAFQTHGRSGCCLNSDRCSRWSAECN